MLTVILLSGISIACCCVNVRLYKIISELEDRLAIQNKYRWTNSSNPVFQNDSVSDLASDSKNQIPKTNSAADMKPATWGEFSSFHIPPSFAQKNNQSNTFTFSNNSLHSTWDNVKTHTASLTQSVTKSMTDKIKNVVRQFEPLADPVLESGSLIHSNTPSNNILSKNIHSNDTHSNDTPLNNINASMYVPPNLTLADENFVSADTNFASESSYITASNTFNDYNTFSNIETPPFVIDSGSRFSEYNSENNTLKPTLYDPLLNNLPN